MSHEQEQDNPKSLVVVSNRLPVTLQRSDTGQWEVHSSTGGLVTALVPLLGKRKGMWIGWPGILEETNVDELLKAASQARGYILKPVLLTPEEVNKHYFGFSNQIIWPLFHDLQSRCNFDPAYWSAYRAVNHKFAQTIIENATADDYIWIQDYHLILVGRVLRSMGMDSKLGFFLHTPFPPLEMFIKLPWRSQIIEAFLEYDLVGFQTLRDRNNFLHCIEAMLKGHHVDARRQLVTITTRRRETIVGSFPISIDFREFTQQAASKVVANATRQLREAIPDRKIVLGVDRLDYSKGIPEKLRAFRNALERFHEIRRKILLIQIVVPSREDIPEYTVLRAEIEGLISEINGKFTTPGWIPVHYMFRSLPRTELLAYYRAADIALVTPLKDGMNLVSKEYCVAKTDKDGVLILSEFAGAASQLHRYSLIVNPYDVEGVADAIVRAYHMSADERQWRMRRLRKSIAKRDVFWWVSCFLQAAGFNS